VLLAEVQQTSDITYRIYDYDRLDLNGEKRELHTDLAAQALDYTVYPNYRNAYQDQIDEANPCLDTEHFSVRVLSLTNPMRRNMVTYDSFVIATCVQGQCTIRIRSTQDEVSLREGFSCLIPAAIADYDIIPNTAETKLLESYINNAPRKSLKQLISQFLHWSV
jgi:mannose-6-phosphate isomerase